MINDDDDPVISEIPVYLSRDLEDKLFIFQYPALPITSPSSKLNVFKSQIKPENQEVILELGLDSKSHNYDRSHGEQIALNADKDKQATVKSFASKCMDHLRLESKKAEIDLESYAVGTMVHGSLILTPLKGAVSLVPSLSHFGSKTDESQAVVPEEEAKMVRVQFSKVETEKSKKARQQSYSYYCQKSAEEPWYHTEYHGPSSSLTQVERQRLAKALMEGRTPLSSVDYLDSIAKQDIALNNNVASGHLSLTQRVTELLTRVKGIKTSVAAEVIGVTEAEILPCLQTSGVLVQGVWVLRSDLRYVGAHHAVPQEMLIRARDYVLLQYFEGRAIERVKLGEIIRLPPEVILEIVSEVGKLNQHKAWIFCQPQDVRFMTRYPEIVEQQALLWEARANQVTEGLTGRRRRRDSGRKGRGNSLSEDDSDTTKRG
ncbi:unnamed protein product [Nezara viridula]|nr:unnamed protein product [Nezara viridula]